MPLKNIESVKCLLTKAPILLYMWGAVGLKNALKKDKHFSITLWIVNFWFLNICNIYMQYIAIISKNYCYPGPQGYKVSEKHWVEHSINIDNEYLSSQNCVHYKQLLGFATFKIIWGLIFRIVSFCTHKKLLQFSKQNFAQVCYSMTDPSSKNQKQKRASPVDKEIETILF